MSDNARITAIFEALAEKLANGLTDLMGCSIEVSLISERRVSKDDFFASFHKKLVMANMDVSGSREGKMHCFCQLKDAVLLGGTLIMLPPAELEKQVRKEEFSEDEADAYGEIVNIVSGELCQAFDEMAVDKLHFKKTNIEVVLPAKVQADADEPFPPGEVYQVSFDLALEGQQLQTMEMVFPPILLGLVSEEIEVPVAPQPEIPAVNTETDAVATVSQEASDDAADAAEDIAQSLVLVIAAREEDVHDLTDASIAEGFVPKVADYQEDFQPFGPNGSTPVEGVVFSMDESKELGLAAIIKAKAIFGGAVPLIAVGGQWTRSQVLQAVKYGVCDILVMPSSPDDIREKLRQNIGTKKT